MLHRKCCGGWLHYAIFKNHLLQQENCCCNTATKSNLFDFVAALQQHFLTKFCCVAQTKILWATMQILQAHAMQQIALHALEKIA